jgi:hypothetical protein
MRLYERLWRGFWSVVAAIGVGVGVLEWSAIGVLLILGPLVVLCCVVQHLLPDIVPGSSRWSATRGGLRQSLRVAIGILTVWSFVWVLPALGLFVVMTAGLSWPAVIRGALLSARGPRAAGHNPPASASRRQVQQPEEVADADSQLSLPEAMGPLNGLDDRQLCRLWRDSFWLLHNPTSPGRMLCRIALREACLDELERRDAAGLHAWLDSGARASSGPEKYLAHPHEETHIDGHAKPG